MTSISSGNQKHQVKSHIIVTDQEWSTKHVNDENWAESSLKSRDHPHRTLLVDKISEFVPVHSVLEIGCAFGANLYHMARKFPDAELRGIDINPLAVQKGNEWFKREGLSNVRLEVGKAQELEQFENHSFDVVVTDAVLIYITPDEIKQVMKELLRVGRGLVLNEWHTFSKPRALLLNTYYSLRLRSRQLQLSIKPKAASLGLFVGHWARDYRALLEEFVPKEKVRITKLPKGCWGDEKWQRWGALIDVRG